MSNDADWDDLEDAFFAEGEALSKTTPAADPTAGEPDEAPEAEPTARAMRLRPLLTWVRLAFGVVRGWMGQAVTPVPLRIDAAGGYRRPSSPRRSLR